MSESNILLVVFGFIHEMQKHYDISEEIPMEIIHLIVLYFYYAPSDLSQLDVDYPYNDITIDKILDILHFRYSRFGNRSIYTAIGNRILIAINAFKEEFNENSEQCLINKYIEYCKDITS